MAKHEGKKISVEVGDRVRLTRDAWRRFRKGPLGAGIESRNKAVGVVKRLVGDWLVEVKWRNGVQDSLLVDYVEVIE